MMHRAAHSTEYKHEDISLDLPVGTQNTNSDRRSHTLCAIARAAEVATLASNPETSTDPRDRGSSAHAYLAITEKTIKHLDLSQYNKVGHERRCPVKIFDRLQLRNSVVSNIKNKIKISQYKKGHRYAYRTTSASMSSKFLNHHDHIKHITRPSLLSCKSTVQQQKKQFVTYPMRIEQSRIPGSES